MGSYIYLHVGPPKTATTYVQKEFLSKVRGLHCLVKPKVEIGERKVGISNIISLSDEVWNHVGEKFLRELSRPARKNRENLVISNEEIYGGLATPHPLHRKSLEQTSGGVEMARSMSGRPHPSTVVSHLKRMKEVAIKIGFNGIRVIFITRRQDTKIASGYAEMSSMIKGASQKDFEEWVNFILNDIEGYYGMGGLKLDYLSWYKRASNVLGKSNILILPMEMINNSTSEFLKRWIEFFGVQDDKKNLDIINNINKKKVRSRSESKDVWLLSPPVPTLRNLTFRTIKKLGIPLSKNIKNYLVYRDKKIKLKEDIKSRVINKYKKSNKKLDKYVKNESLDKYNYY